MRCLYCGKQLALFRRLTGGGEFCSDTHKTTYHDDFNRLALARLKQAQEKSDEHRGAAPQNQLALTRRAAGEPESSSIRSNAHWVDPKPVRNQPRKPLPIATPVPEAESPTPKQAEFLADMPQPAQSVLAPAGTIDPESMAVLVQSRKPEWSPPLGALQLPAPGRLDGTLPPLPRAKENSTQVPTSPVVDTPTLNLQIPRLAVPVRAVPVYKDHPAVVIDPLRFAPIFAAQFEIVAQILPLRFDFTAFTAPDFDILEASTILPPQLKVRPLTAVQGVGQEHGMDLPTPKDPPLPRRGIAIPKALSLDTGGTITVLASPGMPLYKRPAGSAGTRVKPDVFRLPPPIEVVTRSAARAFQVVEKMASAAETSDQDNEPSSTLKVKSNTMTPDIPAPAGFTPARPNTMSAGTIPSRTVQGEPVKQGAQPLLSSPPPPRRRTVPFPSILEVPMDTGSDEQKSLWGTLRKYLKK